MKYLGLLFIAIVALLSSCTKEEFEINTSCDIEFAQVHDVYYNSYNTLPLEGNVVIYFKYDKVSVNSLFDRGIGDSLQVTTGSSIAYTGHVSNAAITPIIQTLLCDNYDSYYGPTPESFTNYIEGSRRLVVYEANKQGNTTRGISEWDAINPLGNTVHISATRPNHVYKF